MKFQLLSNKILNKFTLKSEFSKNVFILLTGTAISQAMPVLTSPILTRLYTPEDFGIFAIFFSIISIMGSVANGRYELAIMLPRKDEYALNLFALGLIILFCFTFLLFILSLFYNSYFATILGYEHEVFWIYFVPIAVFFIGLFNLLNNYNIRKKYYKDIRNATIIKSIVLVFTQLIFGFFKVGEIGLITGELISRMASNTKLLKNIIQEKLLISYVRKSKMIALMKEYSEFPKYNLFSNLSNIITSQIPFFMIPRIFDISISGSFFLAQRVIYIPSSFIASSISQVFFQNLCENTMNKTRNLPLFMKTFSKLLIIALPITLIIIFFSPIIFEFIFGRNWRVSGEISQYLALTFLVSFIASPLSISIVSYKKLKILAYWQYLYLFTTVALFIITSYIGFDFNKFLQYYVIHQVVLYLLYFSISLYIVYKMDKKLQYEN